MTGNIAHDEQIRTWLAPAWDTQSEALRDLEKKLSSAPTGGLPPSAQSAVRAFLDMWQKTARNVRVTTEVYADELREVGLEFENLETEIARRLDAMGPGN